MSDSTSNGEPYSVVVDGVERLVLWVEKGSPDPLLKAGHYENGEGWVKAADPVTLKVLGYARW